MSEIDPKNPRNVRKGQVWSRLRRGSWEEVTIIEVDATHARVIGDRSSRVNLARGFDDYRLSYDPYTAPPRVDLHSTCDGCGHDLLMHGVLKLSNCRKKTCSCEAWSGSVHYLDPLTKERIS